MHEERYPTREWRKHVKNTGRMANPRAGKSSRYSAWNLLSWWTSRHSKVLVLDGRSYLEDERSKGAASFLILWSSQANHIQNKPKTRSAKRKARSLPHLRLRKKVLFDCPRYRSSDPRTGREKGQPNYRECIQLLKSNDLPCPCPQCQKAGMQGKHFLDTFCTHSHR